MQRGPDNDEACLASWSWVKPVHFLEDRLQGQPGVTLSWSSRSGPSGGWSYTVVGESGPESGRLPVPVLADPSVIVEMMLHLWRGRPRLLRASEERWEWAEITESTAASAAVLSEDKYDLDYQLDEEEAAGFEQWQAELESTDARQEQQTAAEPDTAPAAHGEDEGPLESAEPTRYRIVAQCTDPDHPGAEVLTHYAYGHTVEEAMAQARAVLEGPGTVYGDRGLYRVVEVSEESPLTEERKRELARRRVVDWVMEAAQAELQEPTGVPHSEMYGLLCDFFTRAIVFPGWGFPFGTEKDDDSLHTSDPARALSRLLLEHLTHHQLELRERDAR
ncbi:hypothetical protein ACIGHB_33430 [Streptomyces sp. NPDC085460]|uniref:hypothetical protein n=1 Tax=Streptomyces sp. NPDC085460 TaxID=3365723 RepID=UPI0037D5A5EA